MFVNNFDNLCTFCDEAETGFLSTTMTLCNSSIDTVPSAAAVTVMLKLHCIIYSTPSQPTQQLGDIQESTHPAAGC